MESLQKQNLPCVDISPDLWRWCLWAWCSGTETRKQRTAMWKRHFSEQSCRNLKTEQLPFENKWIISNLVNRMKRSTDAEERNTHIHEHDSVHKYKPKLLNWSLDYEAWEQLIGIWVEFTVRCAQVKQTRLLRFSFWPQDFHASYWLIYGYLNIYFHRSGWWNNKNYHQNIIFSNLHIF